MEGAGDSRSIRAPEGNGLAMATAHGASQAMLPLRTGPALRTRACFRDNTVLPLDPATLQHCVLPHCTIPQLVVLTRVSRLLRQLAHKEFCFRAERLLHLLDVVPGAATGRAKWDRMTLRLLLKHLSLTGQPLSPTQRLNLLAKLADEGEWLEKMATPQHRQVLKLAMATLSTPDGIVPAAVRVVVYLGELETAQYRLTPIQRKAFWKCLTEAAFEAGQHQQQRAGSAGQQMQHPLPANLPVIHHTVQPAAAAAQASAPRTSWQKVLTFPARLLRH